MNKFRYGILPATALAAYVLATTANAQSPLPAPAPPAPAPTTSLGVSIALPQPIESTVATITALTTSGAAALKTYKSDARTLTIHLALSKAILSAGASVTTINLGKADADASLGAIALLCTPRQNYMTNSVYLNYLSTLVQNINAVSAKPAQATDIISALTLLMANANYTVADDNVKIDSTSLSALMTMTLKNCQTDLNSYAVDYYGMQIHTGPAAAAAAAAPPAGGVDTFAFLGPIGTLIDTFLTILQPVLTQAANAVDAERRQEAIDAVMKDAATQSKINTAGLQLADAVDKYAASSRHIATGQFVEQLVSIRDMTIDLSGVADCTHLTAPPTPPNAVPNAAFIGCFSAAWSKLQTPVANLVTLGNSYDTLADANAISAKSLFNTIMANWAHIASGDTSYNSTYFLQEITQFITFAQAVAAAASQNNLSALKSAAAAVSK
jgi:hypothetical protein